MKKLLMVVAVAAGLLVTQKADAGFKLRVTDLGTAGTITVSDNQLGPPADLDPATGTLSFILFVDNFKVTITGVSKPFLTNDPSHAEIDLMSLAVVKTGGSAPDTVRIELTDTGFNLLPAGTASVATNIGGTGTTGTVITSKAIVQLQGVGTEASTEFGPSPTFTLNLAPPALGPGAFSKAATGTFAYTGGNFSITNLDEVTLTTTGSSVSFDHDTQVVTPAPGGLVLLASGVLTLLGFRLRRKKVVA